MKQKTSLIAIIITLSFTATYALYHISNELNHNSNHFLRLFPPHITTVSNKVLDLKYPSFYIAGVTAKNIFLAAPTAPGLIVSSTLDLEDTTHRSISYSKNSILKSFDIKIDSPYFYIMDGITPAIFRGNIKDFKANLIPDSIVYFTASVSTSPTSFILRAYDPQLQNQFLAKQDIKEKKLTRDTSLIKKQIDGLFCTDGMLLYNKEYNRTIYVYYYRNQIIYTDSNLNIRYQGKTIDTVSRAKFKITTLNTPDKIKTKVFASPPLIVNKKSCTSGKYLFVQSGLLSENESKSIAKTTATIDVYSIDNGKYKQSFHIPNFRNQPLTSIAVHGNILVTLNGQYLQTYTLNLD